MLLYWNLCQDEPYQDMTSIMKAVEENVDLEKEFKSFGIKYNNLVELYKGMGTNFKMAFDQILTKINILAQDKTRGSNEKFLKALEGLGRIDKSEVITPEAVVEKMINKIPDEEYRKAETILLVNEKSAEFFRGLCKKFNNSKKIIEKCRIVPSSEIGIMFVKKMLKTMGLIEYINTIILDIGDVNDDGEYNVKDFLKLMEKKEELEKKTGVKKFDICLMNPPYNGTMHIRFLENVSNIANTIISVQPIIWLFGQNKNSTTKDQMNSLFDDINKYESSVEKIDATKFPGAAIPQDTGIITINKNKEDNNINIQGFGDTFNIKSIFDIKKYGNNTSLHKLDEKINNLLKSDNIWKHLKYGPRAKGHLGKKINELKIDFKPNPDDIIVTFPQIRGHINCDDFYTACEVGLKPLKYKNYNNKGKTTPWSYIVCNDYKYGENLINYIKTDFVRICLYFSKFSTHLPIGNIPWFDFSQDIFSKSPKEIDDYLFKKFKVDNDTRKQIEDILPDYYNIRK